MDGPHPAVALLAKVVQTWPDKGILRMRHCLEPDAARLCRTEGWFVLIRDSEFPVPPSHYFPPTHSPRLDDAPRDYGEA